MKRTVLQSLDIADITRCLPLGDGESTLTLQQVKNGEVWKEVELNLDDYELLYLHEVVYRLACKRADRLETLAAQLRGASP